MFAGCSLLGRAAPGDDAVFGDGDAGRKIVSEIFGHFG